MHANIDLTGLIALVIQYLVPVLAALACWALKKVADYAHFQISEGQRAMVRDAIANGLAYAAAQLPQSASADARVAAAVAYVQPKIPGALKALKVTPEHLAELVTARLAA